jgi:hypothetical protein
MARAPPSDGPTLAEALPLACGQARAVEVLAPAAADAGPAVNRAKWRALAAFLAFAALWWLFTAASRCDGGRPRPTELIPAGQPDGRK